MLFTLKFRDLTRGSGAPKASLSTFDFLLFIPHYTIIFFKKILIYLSGPSKRSSKMKVHFILPVTIRKRFTLLQTIEGINFGLVRMYVTPYHLLDDIYIGFGNKFYRQTAGIPIDANCSPRVADLFLICYEKRFLDIYF